MHALNWGLETLFTQANWRNYSNQLRGIHLNVNWVVADPDHLQSLLICQSANDFIDFYSDVLPTISPPPPKKKLPSGQLRGSCSNPGREHEIPPHKPRLQDPPKGWIRNQIISANRRSCNYSFIRAVQPVNTHYSA